MPSISTYFAVWMSGSLVSIYSSPETLAPSYRVQVFI